MNEKQYKIVINFCKKTKFRERAISFLCEYSPIVVIGIYVISIIYLLIEKDKRIFLFIIIPALDLFFVSILRNILNRPRPYDELNYTPLVKYKSGKGKSFPSRHTASGIIIAMACLYINKTLGVFTMILGLLIGISRVIVGVHYIKDVIFGIIISIIFGYIGFFLFWLFMNINA